MTTYCHGVADDGSAIHNPRHTFWRSCSVYTFISPHQSKRGNSPVIVTNFTGFV